MNDYYTMLREMTPLQEEQCIITVQGVCLINASTLYELLTNQKSIEPFREKLMLCIEADLIKTGQMS